MSDDRLIRLANLRAICDARGLDASGLCAILGSRYTYWRDMLEGVKPSFGEKIARRIEDGLILPRGWLDVDHSLEAVGATASVGSATLTPGEPIQTGIGTTVRDALNHIAATVLHADQTEREMLALVMRDVAVRPESLETTLGTLFKMIGVLETKPAAADPAVAVAIPIPIPIPIPAEALPANVHSMLAPMPPKPARKRAKELDLSLRFGEGALAQRNEKVNPAKRRSRK